MSGNEMVDKNIAQESKITQLEREVTRLRKAYVEVLEDNAKLKRKVLDIEEILLKKLY